jgi:hypothetical protein
MCSWSSRIKIPHGRESILFPIYPPQLFLFPHICFSVLRGTFMAMIKGNTTSGPRMNDTGDPNERGKWVWT